MLKPTLPSRQPSPVHGVATLTLSITRDNKPPTEYRLTPLPVAADIGQRAWRLTKMAKDGLLSDAHYDVVMTNGHGPHCDCPDYNYRRTNQEHPCKHIMALRALCLI